MTIPTGAAVSTALLTVEPPPPPSPSWLEDGWPWQLLLILLALALAGLFAVLRTALARSVPSRVVEPISDEARRGRLEALLDERAEALAFGAGVLELLLQLSVPLLAVLASDSVGALGSVWLLVAVVLLVLVLDHAVAPALAARHGDALLRAILPAWSWVQLPLSPLFRALMATRLFARRRMGLPDEDPSARPIVEDLRDVVAEADIKGGLAESEREIIENVMEFHDVDVAEVMTPRTAVAAVRFGDSLQKAVETVAESGHSRLPVYEESVDKIVGVVSARHVIQTLAEGRFPEAAISDLMRPAHFVPETKLVSELLSEFRREKLKIAIVLDEYGGTAGLVTLGDVLGEIVGDFQDEWDDDEPALIRHLDQGLVEVLAGSRVSEVNEALGLDLPEEEDYETLGGFVLSELGHLPKPGERFEHAGTEFSVLEANDRRVLRVGVRRRLAEKSA